jgi:hypothetical protein
MIIAKKANLKTARNQVLPFKSNKNFQVLEAKEKANSFLEWYFHI